MPPSTSSGGGSAGSWLGGREFGCGELRPPAPAKGGAAVPPPPQEPAQLDADGQEGGGREERLDPAASKPETWDDDEDGPDAMEEPLEAAEWRPEYFAGPSWQPPPAEEAQPPDADDGAFEVEDTSAVASLVGAVGLPTSWPGTTAPLTNVRGHDMNDNTNALDELVSHDGKPKPPAAMMPSILGGVYEDYMRSKFTTLTTVARTSSSSRNTQRNSMTSRNS